MLARTGIGVGALLIAAVGGRLVPSFTRNALSGARAERVPEPYGQFDIAVLFVASTGLVSWVVAPAHPVTAVTMKVPAWLALVMKHLRPFSTHASPSSTALVWVAPESEPALGSVRP